MQTKELFDLSGKVAVVTGGGSGLGRQMATALAEMGADVVLCARNAERCAETAAELSALGVRAFGLRCDVTSADDVRAMVERAKAELGTIDILVNNAGRAWVAPVASMAVEDWRRVLDVNLTGAFLCSQAAGNVMIAQGGGKIINIASVAGLGGAMPEVLDSIAYNTSKGGLINFTRDLAVKWGRHKINVNAIAPGWFPSRMSARDPRVLGAARRRRRHPSGDADAGARAPTAGGRFRGRRARPEAVRLPRGDRGPARVRQRARVGRDHRAADRPAAGSGWCARRAAAADGRRAREDPRDPGRARALSRRRRRTRCARAARRRGRPPRRRAPGDRARSLLGDTTGAGAERNGCNPRRPA